MAGKKSGKKMGTKVLRKTAVISESWSGFMNKFGNTRGKKVSISFQLEESESIHRRVNVRDS